MVQRLKLSQQHVCGIIPGEKILLLEKVVKRFGRLNKAINSAKYGKFWRYITSSLNPSKRGFSRLLRIMV